MLTRPTTLLVRAAFAATFVTGLLLAPVGAASAATFDAQAAASSTVRNTPTHNPQPDPKPAPPATDPPPTDKPADQANQPTDPAADTAKDPTTDTTSTTSTNPTTNTTSTTPNGPTTNTTTTASSGQRDLDGSDHGFVSRAYADTKQELKRKGLSDDEAEYYATRLRNCLIGQIKTSNEDDPGERHEDATDHCEGVIEGATDSRPDRNRDLTAAEENALDGHGRRLPGKRPRRHDP
jgi:hypothetical protein